MESSDNGQKTLFDAVGGIVDRILHCEIKQTVEGLDHFKGSAKELRAKADEIIPLYNQAMQSCLQEVKECNEKIAKWTNGRKKCVENNELRHFLMSIHKFTEELQPFNEKLREFKYCLEDMRSKSQIVCGNIEVEVDTLQQQLNEMRESRNAAEQQRNRMRSGFDSFLKWACAISSAVAAATAVYLTACAVAAAEENGASIPAHVAWRAAQYYAAAAYGVRRLIVDSSLSTFADQLTCVWCHTIRIVESELSDTEKQLEKLTQAMAELDSLFDETAGFYDFQEESLQGIQAAVYDGENQENDAEADENEETAEENNEGTAENEEGGAENEEANGEVAENDELIKAKDKEIARLRALLGNRQRGSSCSL